MQTDGADLVEFTVAWNVADHRHAQWIVSKRSELAMAALGAVTVLWVFASYEIHVVPAAAFSFIGVYLIAMGPFQRWRVVNRTPNWAISPTTYRLDHRGIHSEGHEGTMMVPWAALTGVEMSKKLWMFAGVNTSICIPRRTLAEATESMIEASVRRHSNEIGQLAAR